MQPGVEEAGESGEILVPVGLRIALDDPMQPRRQRRPPCLGDVAPLFFGRALAPRERTGACRHMRCRHVEQASGDTDIH